MGNWLSTEPGLSVDISKNPIGQKDDSYRLPRWRGDREERTESSRGKLHRPPNVNLTNRTIAVVRRFRKKDGRPQMKVKSKVKSKVKTKVKTKVKPSS